MSLLWLQLATMAATSWFGCDNRKSRGLSASISHVSRELFMRLRLVSVVGGVSVVWQMVRCPWHSVLSWSLLSTGCTVSEFMITVMSAIYIDLASHWLRCGLYRNMYPIGNFLLGWWVPSWGKDPTHPLMKGHDNNVINACNLYWFG